MFEITKKANRYSDDQPEVIAYADSQAEAEAQARDLQHNVYRASAYISIRRAGESSLEELATEPDPGLIAYHDMTIEGFENKHFLVAKLRRVSSPPVEQSSVSDPKRSALGRLADIIRLGNESRNYVDLKAAERSLAPAYMASTEDEWAEYERIVCQALDVATLQRLSPTTLQLPNKGDNRGRHVSYHRATMS
ncbi:MAG: hypothetical protein WCL32_24605, partial [Planctomycetota bacterium]